MEFKTVTIFKLYDINVKSTFLFAILLAKFSYFK